MVDFKLDTSGFVEGPPQGVRTKRFYWSDLSPFAQGYVEAAKQSYPILKDASGDDLSPTSDWGFSDFFPEALALILKDCEAWIAEFVGKSAATVPQRADMGREFWRIRQEGRRRTFPPLTVSLGNDGKIHLSPSHEHGAAK